MTHNQRNPDGSGPQHSPFEIVEVAATHAIGVWGPITLAAWRTETRSAAVMTLGHQLRRCRRMYGTRIALLQVIESGASAPSAEAKALLGKLHAAYADHIRRSALVHTQGGFVGAFTRAVATGIAMLGAPTKFPHVFFATVEDAVAWIEEDLWPTGNPEAAELREAIEALRREHRYGDPGECERELASAGVDPEPGH